MQIRTLIFLFMLISYIGKTQNNAEYFAKKLSEIDNHYINSDSLWTLVAEESERYFTNDYDEDKDEYIDETTLNLVFLYSELQLIDSAFHYLSIHRENRLGNDLLSYHAFLNLVSDPRFDKYLESCLQKWVGVNHLGIKDYKNSKIVIENLKLETVELAIRNTTNQSSKYSVKLKKELDELYSEYDMFKKNNLKKLIDNYRYPGYSDHGSIIPDKILKYLLATEKSVLLMNIARLEELASNKEISGDIVSSLIDENLVLNGKEQRYGTVYTYLVHFKKYVPYPIENSEAVGERRKRIGLESSLESYYLSLNLRLQQRW